MGLRTHGNGSLLMKRCFGELVGFFMEIEFLCTTNVKTGEATLPMGWLWDASDLPGEGPFLHGHGVSQPFSLDQMVPHGHSQNGTSKVSCQRHGS